MLDVCATYSDELDLDCSFLKGALGYPVGETSNVSSAKRLLEKGLPTVAHACLGAQPALQWLMDILFSSSVPRKRMKGTFEGGGTMYNYTVFFRLKPTCSGKKKWLSTVVTMTKYTNIHCCGSDLYISRIILWGQIYWIDYMLSLTWKYLSRNRQRVSRS